MENSFLLQITTPSSTFYDGEIESIVMTVALGQIGIMKGHSPLVSNLRPGFLKIKSNDNWMEAKNGEGFVKIRNNKVEILCSKCIWKHEIEEEDEEPYDHEKEREKRMQSIEEHNRTKSELIKKLSNKK